MPEANPEYKSVRLYETDKGMILTDDQNRIFEGSKAGSYFLATKELQFQRDKRMFEPGERVLVNQPHDFCRIFNKEPSYFTIRRVHSIDASGFNQALGIYTELCGEYQKRAQEIHRQAEKDIIIINRKRRRELEKLKEPNLVELVDKALKGEQ